MCMSWIPHCLFYLGLIVGGTTSFNVGNTIMSWGSSRFDRSRVCSAVGLSRDDFLASCLVPLALSQFPSCPTAELDGFMSQVQLDRSKDVKQSLTLCEAAEIISKHCQEMRETYKALKPRRLLYRGGDLGDLSSDAGLVHIPPDLLDIGTYGSIYARNYFFSLDQYFISQMYPLRPGDAHLMVSSSTVAATWGEPCSVWPLGSIHYAWLEDDELWWPLKSASPDALKRKIFVDEHIDVALRREHEVMLSSSFFPDPGGPAINAFVVVPLRNEKELLGLLGDVL